jgi:hypothetical protein
MKVGIGSTKIDYFTWNLPNRVLENNLSVVRGASVEEGWPQEVPVSSEYTYYYLYTTYSLDFYMAWDG